MAHAFEPSTHTRRQPAPWPRRQRRRWARANDLATASTLMAVIPSLPRALLARLAERMIDRLDELDGDPDVEFSGDELDGGNGEDDFYPHAVRQGHPGDPEDAEDDDPDCCLCREDIGTDHQATAKMGFDANHDGEDAEENGDLEPRDPSRKPTYVVDQSLGPIPWHQAANSR